MSSVIFFVAASGFQLRAAPAATAVRGTFRAPVPVMSLSLEQAFKAIDANGDGFLDVLELKQAFKLADEEVDDETFQRTFKMIDINKDGKINLEEFKAMSAQNKHVGLLSWLSEQGAADLGHQFEEVAEPSEFQAARDARLATADTRRFCLDRCLATGHCDALEDLLEMSAAQVQRFCESCGQTDECALEYA